jgi:hypothetical protein
MYEDRTDSSEVDRKKAGMEGFELASQRECCVFRLPEPYGTAYFLREHRHAGIAGVFFLYIQSDDGRLPLHLRLRRPEALTLIVAPHLQSDTPPVTNNTPWARALRNPLVYFGWSGTDGDPPCELVWALAYATFTLWPEFELFRLKTNGFQHDNLNQALIESGLAVRLPSPSAPPGQPITPQRTDTSGNFVVHRASFWQGAGSPFGPRPVWLRSDTQVTPSNRFNSFPPEPLNYTLTTNFPNTRVHTRHPTRPPKPTPGAMIYSRYIPHLDEMFSMIAVDWTNAEHLRYFNTWQNTPRVAEGWNETGTVDEHREYLCRIHNDPHQFAVLGQFDGQPFGYFEIYWAKVSRLNHHLSLSTC